MYHTPNDHHDKAPTDRTSNHANSTVRLLGRRISRKFGLAGMLALFVVPTAALASAGLPGGHSDSRSETTESHNVTSSTTDKNGKKNEQTTHTKHEMHSELKVEHKSGVSDHRSSSLDVTVNGHDVPVPAKGSVHRTFTSQGGNTDVHIQSDQTGSNTSGNSSSSSTVEVQSNSESEVRIDSSS